MPKTTGREARSASRLSQWIAEVSALPQSGLQASGFRKYSAGQSVLADRSLAVGRRKPQEFCCQPASLASHQPSARMWLAAFPECRRTLC